MPDVRPGQMVILKSIPPTLLRGLPLEDQEAILAIVGRPVAFAGYSYGQAEIEFVDEAGDGHSIWVEPSLLQSA
jgi:hypothetical protein